MYNETESEQRSHIKYTYHNTTEQQHLSYATMLPYIITITFLGLSFCDSFTLSRTLAFKTPFATMKLQPNDLFRCKSSTSDDEKDKADANEGIDIDSNPALYAVRLPRATGIEWGTDLSFSFVYVRALEPGGAADMSGVVAVGDQLCQLQSVRPEENFKSIPINLVGAPFDGVMGSFASLDKNVKDIDLVFFRGTKDELIAACKQNDPKTEGDNDFNAGDDIVTITVVEKEGNGSKKVVKKIRAKKGCNVRKTLTDEGINVYQSVTRWTNCKGKQLCGTCIVDITDGAFSTNRKSMDEASTLRENPESYRLSCVTFAYGDITVETFPPIGKAQWTR